MTAQDALRELLTRVAVNNGALVFVSAAELAEWPAPAVAAMKSEKLLTKARSAASVVCSGCERQCVMPVEVFSAAQASRSRAFVVCDKRTDVNRVPIPLDRLDQWRISGELVADLLRRLLEIPPRTCTAPEARRWEIGTFWGATQASHLVLAADRELRLSLAGHSIALADVLEMTAERLVIDKRALTRLADHPLEGGDTESPDQRRGRLKKRVGKEKAKGTKAFLRVVAKEEGISVSRLKQLLKADAAALPTWLDASPRLKGAVSKAAKTRR